MGLNRVHSFRSDTPSLVNIFSRLYNIDCGIFDHDDEEYTAWLKNNPTGYVLNCRKRAQYKLHRATCKRINDNKPTHGAISTIEYKKNVPRIEHLSKNIYGLNRNIARRVCQSRFYG